MANIGLDLPVAGTSPAAIALLTSILAVLTGSQRTITTTQSLVNGSTPAGVQSVSIWFRGNNGTLNGVPVPNGTIQSFSPNKGDDTVGAISYVVPNTGEARVIISYTS